MLKASDPNLMIALNHNELDMLFDLIEISDLMIQTEQLLVS